MSSLPISATTPLHTPSRRMFRWDLRFDVPSSQQSDTREWLRSRRTDAGLEVDAPEAGAWSAGLARAIIESVLGLRDKRQLERWLIPSLFSALKHLRFDEEVIGVGKRTCQPTTWRFQEVNGAVESAVVVKGAKRSYAVALRLEAFRGRWIATALEIA
ncbi:Rv3235 family protein [Schaalia cardiffensis]|uniref:Rv3235 family protein n=1 Tax=Schaalia cardiffensis TaxID=181487 RepID=UPI0023F5338B|nr:Rv3235 family protein [Schaalia cardiffensis]